MTGKLVVFVLVGCLGLMGTLAWGEDATPAAPQVKPCADVLDLTSADLQARLAGLRFSRTIGESALHLSAGNAAKSQGFEFVDPSGTVDAVTTTCTATCPAGYNPGGCNPTIIGGQPACSTLTCTNTMGGQKPGTCVKAVTMNNSTD